ncbi:GNAT family N-acetyltransferase [uncultured Formosa sp.]|uniref:GNAT family N-acetyltransferase n=1 Tax=uncultured Formosa sp. TaxID=255435 RepID=UPI0026311CD7|nr:GNAT family N-acetyltransferase [uncultured Formosa sp.]
MELTVSEIKNDFDFAQYLKIVNSFDFVNPFYRIWAGNLDEVIDERLFYFTLKGDKQKTLIVMPFLFLKIGSQVEGVTYYDVKSPYGYSGPIFNADVANDTFITFWILVDAWYKENNVVTEFLRFSLNRNYKFYSGNLIPTLSNVKGEIVSEDLQWNNFKHKVRNNYRKGVSENLSIHFVQDATDQQNIEIFHNIYIRTMQRINASIEYHYSLNYFQNIIELSKNDFLLAIVYKGDIPISSELILISGDTLFSYLGGTLSEYFNLRPNDFLKIGVIKWARECQYKYYILGGGRKDNDDLYHYKKTFFPKDEDEIYYTGRKIIDKPVFEKLNRILNTADSNENYFPSYRNYVK